MRRVLCYSILLSNFANSNIYRTMKMTNFKNWMVALILMMGVSLTSCFNNEIDPTVTGWAVAKCVNYYPPTFQLESGQKLILSTTSTTSFTLGELYMVYYSFNSEEQPVDSPELKVMPWNNLEPDPLNASSDEQPTSNQVEENAALYAFSGDVYTPNGRVNVDPAVKFSEEYLLMSPVYWFKQITGNEQQQEELKKHSFVITYDFSELKEGDKELVLRIKHVIDGKSEEEKNERVTLATTTKAYDLRVVKSKFEMKTGNKPSKLKLVGYVNTSDDSLEEGKATEEVWDYTFK